MNSLPITVVNDEVIKIGSYLSNKEIMDYTGLQLITI
ncbi:arsenical resistance operon transcriptional repressor ArsD [Tetragenococcus koreensis]|nr:arsenical resistance operon transcriptional repressor ArsD [Tetragenococcus koreensis]